MAPLIEARRDGRIGARDVASLERHLVTCASCAALAQRLSRIAAHVRQPPAPPPSPLAHQRGRLALLRAAAGGRPRSLGRLRHLALAVVTLGALGAITLGSARPRDHLAASARRIPSIPRLALAHEPLPGGGAFEAGSVRTETVLHPSEDARFVRLSPAAGVEQVHLTEGALDLEVRRLLPRERFLVTTADAEVEVRGTVFHVEASGGHIRAVTVREGKVEVRHLGSSALVSAGGSWKPPARSANAGDTPAPVANAAEPAPATREKETSRAFAEGVGLIERGDYATAADRLEAFRRAHPGDARAEDAAYLTILSLQRAGRPAAAVEAARRFLEVHPQSPRRAAVQRLLDHP